MKGKVDSFNIDRGFGFIIGEDLVKYFVHISDIYTKLPLSRGDGVQFVPTESAKGKAAKQVVVLYNAPNRPRFIDLGNTRIKLSNVKNYGISSAPVYYAKVLKKIEKPVSIFGFKTTVDDWVITDKTVWLGTCSELDAQYVHLRRNGFFTTFSIENGSINQEGPSVEWFGDKFKKYTVIKDDEYLYITTFQNENFRFYKGNVTFDIRQKCREIDEYML